MNEKPIENKKDIVFNLVIYFLLIIGFAILLRQLIFNRSFFLDEVGLVLNFERNYLDLFNPLGMGQTSPILFLIIVKFIVETFSYSDIYFRLLPFIFSIFSVWLYYLVLKRLFDKKGRVIGFSLYIFSYPLIYYSNYFHFFSADIFFTILLFLLMVKVIQDGIKIRDTILMAITIVLSIWFSFSAILVVPVFLLILILYLWTRKKRKECVYIITPVVIYSINFICYYMFFLKDRVAEMATNQILVGSWAPFPIKSLTDFMWYPQNILSFFSFSIGVGKFGSIGNIIAIIFIAVFLVGIFYLVKYKSKYIAVFVIILPILLLIASLFKRCPTLNRLYLFYTPIAFIAITYGIMFILNSKFISSFKLKKVAVGVFLFLIFLFPVLRGLYHLIEPIYENNMKNIVQYYEGNKEENDKLVLVVEEGYKAVYDYYATDEMKESNFNCKSVEEVYENVGSAGKVWLILLYMQRLEREEFIEELDDYGIQFINRFKPGTIAERINVGFIPYNIRNYNDPWGEIYLLEKT